MLRNSRQRLIRVGLLCLAVAATADARNRSPIDLLVNDRESRLVTANQTANSVSLVDISTRRVLAELPVGKRPTAMAWGPNQTVLVSCTDQGEVWRLSTKNDRLELVQRYSIGYHPVGLAVTADGSSFFVSRGAKAQVVQVDMDSGQIQQEIEVARWPHHLALAENEQRLAVACSGDRAICVVDIVEGRKLFTQRFDSLNYGQLELAPDGKHVYFPYMIYRRLEITVSNIQRGWVLGTRLGRLRIAADNERREAISLDPRGEAFADPYGVAISPDGQQVALTSSGTHELLLMRIPGLPWLDWKSTDHVDGRLRNDSKRFNRVKLGGRPMAVRYGSAGGRLYVANYLANSIQIVDAATGELADTIQLADPNEPVDLARRGETIFYDAQRSLDQWYSCHSCHLNGGSNAVAMDTHNDGSTGTFKTVLPLFRLGDSSPWTWHGWQTDLNDAMRKSLTVTMQGRAPIDEDARALLTYLTELPDPVNPYAADPSLAESIQRGREVFESSRAGCLECHNGPRFSDGEIHDVGTGGSNDRYDGYNTPSLIGAFARVRLLHDGRAKTLEEVLTGDHAPEQVAGEKLSPEEVADLVSYLKSL